MLRRLAAYNVPMRRGLVIALVSLTAAVAFIVGLPVVRSATLTPVEASVPLEVDTIKAEHLLAPAPPTTIEPVGPGPGSFADVADRLNPAIVNIQATSRGEARSLRRSARPAIETNIEWSQVALEVNRQPTHTLEDYLRLTDGVRFGDVLAIYLYDPQRRQHRLRTMRIEER